MQIAPADAKQRLPEVLGVHHTAFRCFDAEETRRFYEDVLGFELAAALTFDEAPGGGGPLDYLHIFFRLGDGNFVAFFDLPDHLEKVRFTPSSGFNRHIAFKVAGEADLDAYARRIRNAGVRVEGPIDHGFVRSIYTYDPNGIQVEITCPTAVHDQVMNEEATHAREALARWTAATRARKDAARAGAA